MPDDLNRRNEYAESQFPAVFTMHWAGRPVHVCVRHGRALINLARVMGGGLSFAGGGIVPPEAPEGAECSNCVNEARAAVSMKRSDGVDGPLKESGRD